MDEIALGRIARDDGGSALAALDRGFAAVEAQLALLLFRPVTLEARVLEDGLDVFGEIDLGFSAGGIRSDEHGGGEGQRQFGNQVHGRG